MYLAYSGDGQYASAVQRKTKAEGGGYVTTYLGKVLDKERGIYESRERGVFRFDIKTGEFSEPPEDFVPEPKPDSEPRLDHREKPVMTLRFAGTYFIYQFLLTSGLMAVLLSIPGNTKDTMLALLMFYLTSEYADCNAYFWYRHNIAKHLFPNANLKSQRISDFLASFGKQENVYNFFLTLLEFLREKYNSSDGLLIDSTMLPNNIDIPLKKTISKNGEIISGIKMAVVVQKITGIPVFYELFQGNTMDNSILQTILIRLKHLGVNLKSILIDCGFNTPANLDLLYNDDGTSRISFITRVKSNDSNLTREILKGLDNITDKNNLVTYKDRVFFIVRSSVKVGKNKDKDAWLYFGVDVNRQSMENLSTAKNALKKNLALDKVYEKLCNSGFFGLLSNDLYDINDIIPAYYERVPVEQTIDFMKNYAKLLPIEKQNENTIRGHTFLSFIGSIIVRLVQIGLKKSELYVGSTLRMLNDSGSVQFKDAISTDPLEPEVREVYEAFGIEYPAELPLIDGKLLLRDSSQITEPLESSGSNDKKPFTMERAKSLVPGQPPAPRQTPPTPDETPPVSDGPHPTSGGTPSSSDGEMPASDGSHPTPGGTPSSSDGAMPAPGETPPAPDRAQGETEPGKRKRGRPKGSKNKKTLERERAAAAANASLSPTGEAPPSGGRPAGSGKRRAISSPAWPKASNSIASHEGQDGSVSPETQGT